MATQSYGKEQRKASLAVAMDAALAGDTNALGKIERDLGRARFTKPQLGRVARVLAGEGRLMEAVLVLTIRHSLESALEELAPAPAVAVGDGTGKYIVFVSGMRYRYGSLKQAKSMARSMSKDDGGYYKVLVAALGGYEVPLAGYDRGRPVSVG